MKRSTDLTECLKKDINLSVWFGPSFQILLKIKLDIKKNLKYTKVMMIFISN